jgi:hypothetical protein
VVFIVHYPQPDAGGETALRGRLVNFLIFNFPSALIARAVAISAVATMAAIAAGCIDRSRRGEQSAAENYKRDGLLHVALLGWCSGTRRATGEQRFLAIRCRRLVERLGVRIDYIPQLPSQDRENEPSR